MLTFLANCDNSEFRSWLIRGVEAVDLTCDHYLKIADKSPPDWIFNVQEFISWQNSDPPEALWIRGQAACGKSVLAAYVFNKFRHPDISSYALYFACRSDTARFEPEAVLHSLVSQLACQSDVFQEHVELVWKSHRFNSRLTTIKEQFDRLIGDGLHLLTSNGPIFVVLDGIDESPNFRGILTLVMLLRQVRCFRVLVASRSNGDIASAMFGGTKLTLNRKYLDATVATYVQRRSSKYPPTKQSALVNACGGDLVTYFNSRYMGVFLWVQLVFDFLDEARGESDIESILNSIPPHREPESGYRECLARLQTLPRKERALVKEIFTWAVLSKDPLEIEELSLAITLTHRLRYPGIPWSLDTDIFGKLVAVTGEVLNVKEGPDGKLFTVMEGFGDFLIDSDPYETEFAVDEVEGNALIAQACMEYLYNCYAIGTEISNITPTTSSDSRFGDTNCLIKYASSWWSWHIPFLPGLKTETQLSILERINDFLRHDHLVEWIRRIINGSVTWTEEKRHHLSGAVLSSMATLISKLESVELPKKPDLKNIRDRKDSAILQLQGLANAITEAWLTGDPEDAEKAKSAYKMLQDLYFVTTEQKQMEIRAVAEWGGSEKLTKNVIWFDNFRSAH